MPRHRESHRDADSGLLGHATHGLFLLRSSFDSGASNEKLLFAGIAAATLCATTVFAADMPVKAPVYKTAPPIFSWTGCYLGIEGGGGWGQTEQNIAEGPFGDGSTLMLKKSVDGGLIGGTAGCNYQAANWVLGLEGDLSWTNLKGDGLEVPNSQIKLGTKVGMLDTFRGRIGYAYDRTLFLRNRRSGICEHRSYRDFAWPGHQRIRQWTQHWMDCRHGHRVDTSRSALVG